MPGGVEFHPGDCEFNRKVNWNNTEGIFSLSWAEHLLRSSFNVKKVNEKSGSKELSLKN